MNSYLHKYNSLKKYQPIQEDLVSIVHAQCLQDNLKKNCPLSGYKFIDLFAGIGGIRKPFDELGAECVFSSEWDKYAQQTYAANYGDITKIDENYE